VSGGGRGSHHAALSVVMAPSAAAATTAGIKSLRRGHLRPSPPLCAQLEQSPTGNVLSRRQAPIACRAERDRRSGRP